MESSRAFCDVNRTNTFGQGQDSSYANVVKDKVDEGLNKERVSSGPAKLLIADSSFSDNRWLEKSAVGVLKSFSNVAIVKRRLMNRGLSVTARYLGGKAILWSFDSAQDCEGFISNSFFWRDLFSSMEKWLVVQCFDEKPTWFNFIDVALDF
ncbi:hypothetical protein Q3G72_033789 [Acer saccharum]|nr:hypothetical protein Q3G72_033789 [Acer saccharum]